jgi:hypothetical protein
MEEKVPVNAKKEPNPFPMKKPNRPGKGKKGC